MRHLDANALRQRLADVLSNLTVLSSKGLISILDRQNEVKYWMSLVAHIHEEYALRGEGLPAGSTVKEIMRLPKATAPRPPKSAWICEPLLKELEGTNYLVKYGEAKHMRDALENGRWKISAASVFADSALDSARRDLELERVVEMLPEEVHLEVFDGITGKSKGRIAPRENVVMTATSCDYYALCFSRILHVQLFDDFPGSDSCLIIRDPIRFEERLFDTTKLVLPDFRGSFLLVKYFDPLNTNPADVQVADTKHFRFSYQREARFVWYPKSPGLALQREMFVTVGSMKDIALFVQP
jgi:hypothetical protein